MIDKKISLLPAATSLSNTDLITVVASGVTSKMTWLQFKSLLSALYVQGSGTVDRVAVFTASGTIGDGYLLQGANKIMVDSGVTIESPDGSTAIEPGNGSYYVFSDDGYYIIGNVLPVGSNYLKQYAGIGTFEQTGEIRIKAPIIHLEASTSIELVNMTGDRVLTTDSNGTLTPSSVTTTELNYLSGVTSAIQTQLNAKADLVSGVVPNSQLPALALTDVFVVASQAAQLALTAQEGDVAVRTDENKSYIHNGGTAGTMADWQELLTPTDSVTSVFGRTGVVGAQSGDYTASQITNTPSGDIVSTNVQDAINELDLNKVKQTDARLTDSRHEIVVAYQNTDSSHTGSLTQTVLCNLLIPANTMGTNDIFWFESMPFSVGGTSMTWKAYLSPTSGNFAAGTLVAELTGTFLYPTFCRRIANKNSQTTNNVLGLTATGAMLENGGAAQPRSAVNINWTVDQYLIITGTLSNSAHTIGLDNIQCYVKKIS